MKVFTVLLLLLGTILLSSGARAQDAYWVFLKDKNGVSFNPYEYFDAKAIERRIKNGIPLSDSTDWPLNEQYIARIAAIADSISGQTRWFNALAIRATDEQIRKIQALSCVRGIRAMSYYAVPAGMRETTGTAYTNSLRKNQVEIMGAKSFREKGIDGKGVRIAIFDGGFPAVNNNPALSHIIESQRLIDTWDFTKNKAFVFYSITHGTMVMTNIGGMQILDNDTLRYGLATGAEFLLAKTEIRREPLSEEKNWLMAVEWADKKGADIINSSLGYTYQRYFPSDMDGKTSLVTRAANMAASKGILVVNAAGNDGDGKWHTLGAPADADSVLTVGGVSPDELYHISFSSYGPTADGRMKPNVCAFGTTFAIGKNYTEEKVSGTSFASPLVAGFAACALQANPEMKNMELFRLIEKSGHLYPYFDYAHGYGIPQAEFVLKHQKNETAPTFELDIQQNVLHIKISDAIALPIGSSYLMYINFADKDGKLLHYIVVKIKQRDFTLNFEDDLYFYAKDDLSRINVYFNAYYRSFEYK
jgi:subtilisin family serine protease